MYVQRTGAAQGHPPKEEKEVGVEKRSAPTSAHLSNPLQVRPEWVGETLGENDQVILPNPARKAHQVLGRDGHSPSPRNESLEELEGFDFFPLLFWGFWTQRAYTQ